MKALNATKLEALVNEMMKTKHDYDTAGLRDDFSPDMPEALRLKLEGLKTKIRAMIQDRRA